MAKEYKYKGETFQTIAGEHYVEVRLDGEVRYVGPATNCTDKNPYGVSTRLENGKLGWTAFNAYGTLTEGLDGACEQLLTDRAARSLNREAIYKQMHSEFDSLPG